MRFVMPLEIEAPDFRDQSPRPRGGRRGSRGDE
jgi:hypothetical protein